MAAPADETDLGTLSKLLFGHQDRLAVAVAVAKARPEDLYQRALAKQSDVAANVVGQQLQRFVRAGLLSRIPPAKGQRQVLYRRQDSAFWRIAVELVDERQRRDENLS
jgi:hypothetical protein